MNNRIDAIYARQSVDKKDSISIESQIEFCKYELKGSNCKEYTDKGYSGKNTDRPKFQELVRNIKRGLTVEAISPEQISQISGYLDTWENVSFDDKRRVVDLMITTIAATSDSLNITWKI